MAGNKKKSEHEKEKHIDPVEQNEISTDTEDISSGSANDDINEAIDELINEVSRDNGGGGDDAAIRQELEESKDRYLRLMAEFDNFKRRSAKEYERLISAANEKLILEMVDVRENFERALKAGEQAGETGTFFDGMKMIFAKFEEVLTNNGLSVFAEPGDPFDPMIHDALMNTPHAEIPVDHIAEVFERGYRLKDRVIKHARVIVSAGSGG